MKPKLTLSGAYAYFSIEYVGCHFADLIWLEWSSWHMAIDEDATVQTFLQLYHYFQLFMYCFLLFNSFWMDVH